MFEGQLVGEKKAPAGRPVALHAVFVSERHELLHLLEKGAKNVPRVPLHAEFGVLVSERLELLHLLLKAAEIEDSFVVGQRHYARERGAGAKFVSLAGLSPRVS
jgi:hypothetical protein